ncbi:hypothetical protein BJX64DRAFT_280480 [Aspergillus heterothallicus]
MPTTERQSPARLPKRSRASDAAPSNMINRPERFGKRRRTSADEQGSGERTKRADHGNTMALHTTSGSLTAANHEDMRPAAKSWALTQRIAGQFSSLDPILTPDEQYLLLSLETSVHVYSVATSRLFRIIELNTSEIIVCLRLSPSDQGHLHIVTSSGSVSEWDWSINKQLAQWNTQQRTITADLLFENGTNTMLFCLREYKNGKRELAIMPLKEDETRSVGVLETNCKVDNFKIVGDGRVVVAYGGTHLFLGISSNVPGSGSSNYAWREVKLGIDITSVDIRQHGNVKAERSYSTGTRDLPEFDLALGGADGSILVYHAALGLLGITGKRGQDKQSTPRRLHWHRDSVTAVHWSRDGNYLISGGHESVMVLWQLDTGRKQFLPHLSSPICNIIVSSSGNSYGVKLADNRVVVLSARELLPMATITGLQLFAAALHPQHPEQLLITVPASYQLMQDSIASTSAPMLQTYDIRSNTHISRQALARTNATTLNVSPDGTQILAPDIKHISITQDGKWMATVDTLDLKTNNRCCSSHEETLLKFWRWSESSSLWELVTRIDKPHLSDKGSVSVLALSSRPHSHEFATIGSDTLLRFWRPVIRQRYGSKRDKFEQMPENWKCRNTVDLTSISFSDDGSVLAICLQSASITPGLTLLLDVQIYFGDVCATSFLGSYLIIATKRTTDSQEVQVLDNNTLRLLAVNKRTHTFAFTSTKTPQKRVGLNKVRKSGYSVQVFNVDSMSMLSHIRLAKEPVALLSSSLSTEYFVVDTGASVQQLGFEHLIDHPETGLNGLFRLQSTMPREVTMQPTQSAQPSERSGLARVFGDTPPFVLPPSRIVFRDLPRSVKNSIAISAIGFLPNPHPSLIVSAGNDRPFEPSDGENEPESDFIDTPGAQVPSPARRFQPQLTVQTASSNVGHSRKKSDDDELPKSVIHAPTGFSEFDPPTPEEQDTKPSSEGSPLSIQLRPEKKFNSSPISPPPITTSIEPATDWSERATPRAQTRQDFDEIDKRPHSSNLEDIPEGIDKSRALSDESNPKLAHQLGLANEFDFPGGTAEIKALQAALVECWSLCNTLATLSSIHRERTSLGVETQDDAWKSCWRLCQQLYAGQVDETASQVNPTLDLCRDFCQTLFEARTRDNEISDSVLRVSFELNNHLYNTHDRNLPDAFRERTLDFYITLCHRLMKQRTREPETDSLLSACWSLAEMLFSIRQSKKEGRPLDEELLGSAVQACWELCDIFREGWTQRNLRNSDRGTPRPSQATFAPAEKQSKQSDMTRAEEAMFRQRNPETPTTIFEDLGTTSPEEGPVQNIFVLGQRRNIASHTNWPSNVSSVSRTTQSSDRTSSTNTVITLSNDANIVSLKVLMTKAAMNSGFQRSGSQSLLSFVKSLSSDAFGSTPWQSSLLKQFKGLVALEPEFQTVGPPNRASAVDIARAVRLMAQSGQYLWLYDLYRLVFGFHVEEVANRDSIILQA